MRNFQPRSRLLGRALVVLGALGATLLSGAALAQGEARVAPPAQPAQEERAHEPPPPTYAPVPPVPDVRKPRLPQRPDDEAPSSGPSPLVLQPTTAVADDADASYSGQIVLADVGAVVLGGVLSGASGSGLPILLGWSLASPVVHGIHGHPGRVGGSLLLHTMLPIIVGLLGLAAESCSSSQNEGEFCGLGGLVLGGAAGMIAATFIDAAVLARMPDAPAQHSLASAGGVSVAPMLSVGRNGDVSVGWRGRF